MKELVQKLFEVRELLGELAATLAFLFIMVYATHKAWRDFMSPLFRKPPPSNGKHPDS